MNVSLTRSILKGLRQMVMVGVGAAIGSLGSPEVAAAFSDAGVYGTALIMVAGSALPAGWDYVKRKLGWAPSAR